VTDLTPERVRALLDGATPGPWHSAPHCVYAGETPPGPFGGESWVAQTYHDHPLRAREREDASLIAAAPDLALALLAAWAERDEARADERARIVAWLRDEYDARARGSSAWEATTGDFTRGIAAAIERGEHSPDRGEEER